MTKAEVERLQKVIENVYIDLELIEGGEDIIE